MLQGEDYIHPRGLGEGALSAWSSYEYKFYILRGDNGRYTRKRLGCLQTAFWMSVCWLELKFNGR